MILDVGQSLLSSGGGRTVGAGRAGAFAVGGKGRMFRSVRRHQSMNMYTPGRPTDGLPGCIKKCTSGKEEAWEQGRR